jgi:putative transcriptional regulator
MKTVKGHFLIATPQLEDPNFAQTVVFIAEHSAEGGFGLVINRPVDLDLTRLWEALGGDPIDLDTKAHYGGPVERSAVFLLHSCADLASDVEPLIPGVWLGQDRELLGLLIARALAEDRRDRVLFRAYCGYAGWGGGQLDAEIASGSWLVQPATADLLFAADSDDLWVRALERHGGIYSIFAKMPKNPDQN